MKNNRRNFLKMAGGVIGAGIAPSFAPRAISTDTNPDVRRRKNKQHFNMCGYAAPKLEIVRIGIIGIGGRGLAAVNRLSKMEGATIVALGDLRPERLDEAMKKLEGSGHNPARYSGHKDEWKKLCERDDIDLIYITTQWDLHAPMAVYAMEQGKHAAVEVPAAKTIDECWQLVETSEKTRKHCVILENVCYGQFELLTLNMARRGLFGEIIHCEGAYIHTLAKGLFNKNARWDMWRLKENMENNGNLYATHGLGPISQIMNLNRGDKMDYMVSMSSNDFTLGKLAKEFAATDATYQPYVGKSFRGNMNTSIIRTNKGRTLMLQHDVSSPRVYSRLHLVSGTKGMAQEYPLPGKIALDGKIGHDKWLSKEDYEKVAKEYEPPLLKKMGALAKKDGGDGGMDFLIVWRLIECLRNGLPMDIDVYDAALWSSIGELSALSIAKRSGSIDVPDFTRGAWKNNKPLEI